jgi:uncharacterized protein
MLPTACSGANDQVPGPGARRMQGERAANRLADEPSPYLRQHADNPVHWWPWTDAAFAEAKRRGVPVFVSVGYSTCHWCHVMAHESFEDAAVARLLNEAFVCVKVDREERPDVDELCMAACQAMTGSGGWPTTVVMTPQKRPFFAATYIPKESRLGRTGLMDLVPAIRKAWAERRAELERQAEHVMLHLRGEPHGHEGEEKPPEVPAQTPGTEALAAGVEALRRRFDTRNGGFGGAPKFPSPHLLLFLLRWHHRSGDAEALAMVRTTLQAIAQGGLHDHLGGGFHRYSTDAAWHVPHFEKMLYDQAMLALAYAEAHQATGDPAFAATCRSTLDYVLRDLADPEGGFRCGEDADSEGVEGKFYVWTRAEVLGVLGPAGGERLASAYGVTQEGNYAEEHTGRRTGASILRLAGPLAPRDEADLAPLRQQLFEARLRRVRPGLDDKVLTDWNGLAIAAFALAGRVLGEPRYVDAARRAATFLRATMRRPGGGLRHRFRAGVRDEVAFLDDHAYLLWGLLELHAATAEARWLPWATEVAAQLESRFAAPEGGFFHGPADGEDLGLRRREAYDGALPSGNSVAAHALLRLGLLTGEARWTRLAERAVEAFAGPLAEHPAACAMMLCALDVALGPTQEVLVAGQGPEADAMWEAVLRPFAPRRVALRQVAGLAQVAPWTAAMQGRAGQATAYVCEGHACRAPVTGLAALEPLLAPTTPGSRARVP